eukprot:TRINITY_DN533_c2_g1_i2.p1 TRINITY_DN533_c2_g1~~TRINITY_DN533_c2_g1_i2.p1  ORF type:complete len:178 (+),score=50.20 TRINITY_DN533_c2_g1_i2:84-617(+)
MLLTNKTAALRLGENAAEDKLKELEHRLRAAADEAEVQRTELSALTIECNQAAELESMSAVELAQHDDVTQNLTSSLGNAELVLQHTSLNERACTSAHITACTNLEEQDRLLQVAQTSMRRSQAAYLDAQRDLGSIPVLASPLRSPVVPVPIPIPLPHVPPPPIGALQHPITSPLRL